MKAMPDSQLVTIRICRGANDPPGEKVSDYFDMKHGGRYAGWSQDFRKYPNHEESLDSLLENGRVVAIPMPQKFPRTFLYLTNNQKYSKAAKKFLNYVSESIATLVGEKTQEEEIRDFHALASQLNLPVGLILAGLAYGRSVGTFVEKYTPQNRMMPIYVVKGSKAHKDFHKLKIDGMTGNKN